MLMVMMGHLENAFAGHWWLWQAGFRLELKAINVIQKYVDSIHLDMDHPAQNNKIICRSIWNQDEPRRSLSCDPRPNPTFYPKPSDSLSIYSNYASTSSI